MSTEVFADRARPGTGSALPDRLSGNLAFWLRLVYQPEALTRSLREKHGDLVRVKFAGQTYVIALTSESARPILAADPGLFTAFWKEPVRALAGTGSILAMDGSRHHQERQLLTPAFHGPGIAGYGGIIQQTVRQYIGDWHSGNVVRAFETTSRISQDVIMRLVFGVEEPAFLKEGRRVLDATLRAMHPLIVFVAELQKPWFPPWRRHLRAREEFSAWVGHCLARARAQPAASGVLGRMLDLRYEDGTPISDEDIRDELYTVLLAGHETTAAALAWALYELGRNPAVLTKLRAEVGGLGPGPSPEAVAKLPYLSAVCNETLRLHTILGEVGRKLAAPFQLAGHTIPAGDALVISISSIHHDPCIYQDPHAFVPERFLNRTYGPFEFLPFGGGHRRCLGSALSDYEMRIALAEIVMSWDFEATVAEREVRRDIGMGPEHGVRLRITGRRQTPVVRHIAEPEADGLAR
jgi:cytochrome P450